LVLSTTALTVPVVTVRVTIPCDAERSFPPASFTRTVTDVVDVPSAARDVALVVMVVIARDTGPNRPAANWKDELVTDARPGDVNVSV
jgi:hypothetical protein